MVISGSPNAKSLYFWLVLIGAHQLYSMVFIGPYIANICCTFLVQNESPWNSKVTVMRSHIPEHYWMENGIGASGTKSVFAFVAHVFPFYPQSKCVTPKARICHPSAHSSIGRGSSALACNVAHCGKISLFITTQNRADILGQTLSSCIHFILYRVVHIDPLYFAGAVMTRIMTFRP